MCFLWWVYSFSCFEFNWGPLYKPWTALGNVVVIYRTPQAYTVLSIKLKLDWISNAISSGFFLLSTLTRLLELHSWFQLSLTCCIFSLNFLLELKTRKSSWFLEISLTCFIGSLNSMWFKNDLVIFTSNLFLNCILFKWMVWKFPHLWKLETKYLSLSLIAFLVSMFNHF